MNIEKKSAIETADGPEIKAILNRLLLLAVRSGRAEDIDKAIRSGADVNHVDEFGVTAMHIAAVNNDIRAIGTLSRHGARIHGIFHAGISPFDAAVIGGRMEAVKVLSTHCVDLEPHPPSGNKATYSAGNSSVLENALYAKRWDIAQWLIEHGANVHCIDDEGTTLSQRLQSRIHIDGSACCAKALGLLARVGLPNEGASGTSALSPSHQAFQYAIDASGEVQAEDAGADPTAEFDAVDLHATPDAQGATGALRAKMICAIGRVREALRRVVPIQSIQAIPSSRASLGTKQLLTSLAAGDATQSLHLLECGDIDANAMSNQGVSALHLAARIVFTTVNDASQIHTRDAAIKVVAALIEQGACIASRLPGSFDTLLHIALRQGDEEFVMWLLTRPGARILLNLANTDLDRPLHLAAAHKRADAIAGLIAAGADLNPINRDGYSPLHLCVYMLDVRGAEQLISMGANTHLCTRAGDSIETILRRRKSEGQILWSLVQARESIDSLKSIFSTGNPLADVVRSRKTRLSTSAQPLAPGLVKKQ